MEKFILRLKVELFISILTVFSFTINSTLFPQSIEYIPKRGGIGFRIDDNQDLEKYNDYAAIFNKYNLNFLFALNLGTKDITEEYIEMIRDFQSDGHEMMDHTPNHRTNYFYSKFDVSRYIEDPGVYKVLNNKVYLKYESINTDLSKYDGFVSIDKNIIHSSEGIFKNFTKYDCYLYFPSISQLIFIDDTTGWIDDYTVMAMDFWRDSINLGTISNIEFFSFNYNSVHLTFARLN